MQNDPSTVNLLKKKMLFWCSFWQFGNSNVYDHRMNRIFLSHLIAKEKKILPLTCRVCKIHVTNSVMCSCACIFYPSTLVLALVYPAVLQTDHPLNPFFPRSQYTTVFVLVHCLHILIFVLCHINVCEGIVYLCSLNINL